MPRRKKRGGRSDQKQVLERLQPSAPAGSLARDWFFADLEGHEDEPKVAEALAALRARVETLRVLGSYPAAKA